MGPFDETMFQQLTRLHHAWVGELENAAGASVFERRYNELLKEFQHVEGPITNVYWAERSESGAALTARKEPARRGVEKAMTRALAGGDERFRLHLAIDRPAPAPILNLLRELQQRGDTATSVPGVSNRIVMTLIFNWVCYLLAFVDRADGRPSDEEVRRVEELSRRELEQIDGYSKRASTRWGRIVYFAERFLWLLRDFVFFPLGAVALLVAVDFALGTPFQWIFLASLLLFSIWAVTTWRYWTEWLPMVRRDDVESWFAEFLGNWGFRYAAPVLEAIRTLVLLTVAFAALTAVFTQQHWLTIRPRSQDSLVWAAVANYTWHFLDAIPVLDVPQTLNWDLGHRFTDHSSGVLLLVYKLIVIFPVIRAIVKLTEAWKAVPEVRPVVEAPATK